MVMFGFKWMTGVSHKMIHAISTIDRVNNYGSACILGGVLTINGMPCIRNVQLYITNKIGNSSTLVSSTWSNDIGEFAFVNMHKRMSYEIKAVDYLSEYENVYISNVVKNTLIDQKSQYTLVDDIRNNIPLNTMYYKHPITFDTLVDSNSQVYGTDALNGFVEGANNNELQKLTLHFENTKLYYDIITNYGITNIHINNLQYIEYDSKRQPFKLAYHTNMKPGYITGSVNNSCDGTDFKIRVYREDGFFIGDYDIAENGSYEIPNLNVHSSYDVLLYDLNLAVETQVNSRRIPTAYSVTE